MTTRSPSGRSLVDAAVALANVHSSCDGQGRPPGVDPGARDRPWWGRRDVARVPHDPHRVGPAPTWSARCPGRSESWASRRDWHSLCESANTVANAAAGCQLDVLGGALADRPGIPDRLGAAGGLHRRQARCGMLRRMQPWSPRDPIRPFEGRSLALAAIYCATRVMNVRGAQGSDRPAGVAASPATELASDARAGTWLGRAGLGRAGLGRAGLGRAGLGRAGLRARWAGARWAGTAHRRRVRSGRS